MKHRKLKHKNITIKSKKIKSGFKKIKCNFKYTLPGALFGVTAIAVRYFVF